MMEWSSLKVGVMAKVQKYFSGNPKEVNPDNDEDEDVHTRFDTNPKSLFRLSSYQQVSTVDEFANCRLSGYSGQGYGYQETSGDNESGWHDTWGQDDSFQSDFNKSSEKSSDDWNSGWDDEKSRSKKTSHKKDNDDNLLIDFDNNGGAATTSPKSKVGAAKKKEQKKEPSNEWSKWEDEAWESLNN